MKAMGIATLIGIGSGSAGGTAAKTEQASQTAALQGLNFQVVGLNPTNEQPISQWEEVRLPTNQTSIQDSSGRYSNNIGDIEYGEFVMGKSLDGSGRVAAWRQQVLSGKLEKAQQDFTVQVFEEETRLAEYQVTSAWPKAYSPPQLGADDEAATLEQVTLEFEDVRRVDPTG
jgi:phage tail-like protein